MKVEIPDEINGRDIAPFLYEKQKELTDMIVQDPELLAEFVSNWNKMNLHDYSINNLILAFFQTPIVQGRAVAEHSTTLAGFNRWKDLGRAVLRKAEAIKVIAPRTRKFKDKETEEDEIRIIGWRYVNVFDVSQTGVPKIISVTAVGSRWINDPYPQDLSGLEFGHSDLVKSDNNLNFDLIIELSPVPVKVGFEGVTNGSITKTQLVVAPKTNEISMIATGLHEIAHYKLGHLEPEVRKELTRDAREVEAESVSFIVGKYLGIDNQKSKLYIGHWNIHNKELVGRGSKILEVAEEMIEEINQISSNFLNQNPLEEGETV